MCLKPSTPRHYRVLQAKVGNLFFSILSSGRDSQSSLVVLAWLFECSKFGHRCGDVKYSNHLFFIFGSQTLSISTFEHRHASNMAYGLFDTRPDPCCHVGVFSLLKRVSLECCRIETVACVPAWDHLAGKVYSQQPRFAVSLRCKKEGNFNLCGYLPTYACNAM